MTFAIDNALLPATLTSRAMTDDEFAEFCSGHPDLSFEMTADGQIIVMPPNFSLTGAQNFELALQLGIWSRKDGRGIGCDSSTGFVLPNGARRSPDASWVLRSRVDQLEPVIRSRYWRLSPDFVIELQSQSDRPKALREKMEEWIANGARLGWLIDPANRQVTIYRPGSEVEVRTGIDSIAGEGPVNGFVLELGPIWNLLS